MAQDNDVRRAGRDRLLGDLDCCALRGAMTRELSTEQVELIREGLLALRNIKSANNHRRNAENGLVAQRLREVALIDDLRADLRINRVVLS